MNGKKWLLLILIVCYALGAFTGYQYHAAETEKIRFETEVKETFNPMLFNFSDPSYLATLPPPCSDGLCFKSDPTGCK